MEKIKPNLFLNFNRQIGKNWKQRILDNMGPEEVTISGVRAFYEALVPAAGSGAESGKVLAAISNAIYIDARRHNMSLSAFGHLDPIKFAIAALFPFLVMGEVKRDLGIACHYEFGNLTYGASLSTLAGYDLNDTLENFTTYASRYNKLVARLNQLMIPEVGLFTKWLKHRLTIYKDDEGERYSLYLYKLQNIYELDVDANSSTAGQLLCKWRKDTFNNNANTIGQTLDYLEDLLAKYEGDDDMVTFATEAIKAGMSHLSIDTIPSTSEAFAQVDLPVLYELDDIFSLENARFVTPITEVLPTSNSRILSWDIIEDNDQFYVGRMLNPQGSELFTGYLPVFIAPYNLKDFMGVDFPTFEIKNCPIITHSKIVSETGLEALTRYMCSATRKINFDPILTTTIATIYYGRKSRTITSDESGLIYSLTTFNTEVLCGCEVLIPQGTAPFTLPVTMNFLGSPGNESIDSNESLVLDFIEHTIGFKACFSVYDYHSDGWLIPMMRDYDYVTSVTEDAIQNYFAVNAWNYSQLVHSK